jgi:L-ascorbate metabolism protein UlaG (beta-lactamase superfamily)
MGTPADLRHIHRAAMTKARLVTAFTGSAQYWGPIRSQYASTCRVQSNAASFSELTYAEGFPDRQKLSTLQISHQRRASMKIIWLGHGSFRIEIEDQTLLIDPWLTGNPVLPEDQHEAATQGADHILITHGHFDHTADVVALSKKLGAPAVGMYDFMGHFEAADGLSVVGFNIGGTVMLGRVSVSMVPALHSNSYAQAPDAPVGREVGFILKGEGHTIYISGDTGIMADMDWIAEYYQPDIGILSAGGHFTMDMKQVAYAAKRYFDFKTVIPCHYKTFDILEQSAQSLIDGLPGVEVIEPQIMHAITI